MRSRTNVNVHRRVNASFTACDDNDCTGIASSLDDDCNGKQKLRKRLPPPPQMSSIKKETVAVASHMNTATSTDSPAPQTPHAHQHTQSYHMNQNPYQTSQISHAYKPNDWYIKSRNQRRNNQRFRFFLIVMLSVIVMLLFYFAFKHVQLHDHIHISKSNRHQRHHHDYHHHIHPMTGAFESPLGFAKELSPQIDHSEPIIPKQLPQQPRQELTHIQHTQQPSQQLQSSPEESHTDIEQQPTEIHSNVNQALKESIHETNRLTDESHIAEYHVDSSDVSSFIPVTTLSNGRLLPLIGFGVASLSVNHKEIPVIVNTLLQYASSESEGGGGIAMIDAVIDERREVESNGGSDEEHEEMLEVSRAKTAISVVGRAIAFFAKEAMTLHSDKRRLRSARNKYGHGKEGNEYDYDNRLEIHLLIGLSDTELGEDKTLSALRDVFSELDDLVPQFPNSLDSDDIDSRSTISQIDRHVDLRIHVLLQSPRCLDEWGAIIPCTKHKSTANDEKIKEWSESYDVVEKLYDKRLVSGIGIDGVHVEDVHDIIQRCRIKPQIYRGDVSQVMEGFGTWMGVDNHSSDHNQLQKVLHDQNVTFLASNVAGHILEKKSLRPNAYGLLQHLGSVLYHAHREYNERNGVDSIMSTNLKGGEYYTVPRLILAYLVKHKICVLPHAYKAEHLADDAPESVSSLATFLSKRRMAEIGLALNAMLSDSDLPEDNGFGMEGEHSAAAFFHNQVGQEIHIFRALEYSSGEREVAISSEWGRIVEHGHSSLIIANPGDRFVVYKADGQKVNGNFTLNTESGGAEDFFVQ